MNENEKQTKPQPEKSALDEQRKTALLRYVAIMFAVAFVFVLLSLFGQMRDSRSTISELNQSSSSALQKAEQLQSHNQELEKENAYLNGRIEELEQQMEELQQDLDEANAELDQAELDYDALEKEMEDQLEAAEEERSAITEAYEQLLALQEAVTPGMQAGNEKAQEIVSDLKENLEYLGDYALKIFENLTEKGE